MLDDVIKASANNQTPSIKMVTNLRSLPFRIIKRAIHII